MVSRGSAFGRCVVVIAFGFAPALLYAADAPLALDPTNVTATGCYANWQPVPDASGYALSVCKANEDFSDDTLAADPPWVDTVDAFVVLTNRCIPGGTAVTDGHLMASRETHANAAAMTASTETRAWRFSLATPAFDPSDQNHVGVVLMSDSVITGDVAAAHFQGYYLRLGNNGDEDRLRLYRKPGAGDGICIGTFNTPDFSGIALKDGLNLRVTRDLDGVFELFYATGFCCTNLPRTSAGTLTNALYSTSAWFGPFGHFSSAAPERRVYLDNICFESSPVHAAGYPATGLAADATTHGVSGLDVYTDHYYRLTATVDGEDSPPSNWIHVRTQPAAPTLLPASDVTNTSFTANGSPLDGALSYRLDVLAMDEDFSAGRFSAGTTWTGDVAAFTIATDATAPAGNAATDGSFLATQADTGHVSLACASTETGTWRFSLASPNFDPSTDNFIGVILMAGDPETGALVLEGGIDQAVFRGYFLKLGDAGSADDQIELWRKTGAGAEEIGSFGTPDFDPGALRDGLNIKVTRSAEGIFDLWYDTGFTFASEPAVYAGSLTNALYDTSRYFGVFADFDHPAAFRRVYLDNITLGGPMDAYDALPTANASHPVTALQPDTTCFYRIRAIFPNGPGPYSPWSQVRTLATRPPAAGTIFVVK